MDSVLGNIQIDINGRKYGIGCDDGQEDHIIKLARHFDNHVRNLAQNVGQIGDQKLFLMAALLLADEANDLKLKLDSTEAELARIRDQRLDSAEIIQRNNNKISAIENQINEFISEACGSFDSAASRLEALAKKLDEA